MTGASHRLGGAVTGLLAAEVLTQSDDIAGKAVLLSAAVIGSLVPDIDNPRSSVSCKFPLIRVFVGIFQLLIRGIASLFPSKQEQYIKGTVAHRGISHTLVMVLLGYGLVYSGVLLLPAWQEKWRLAALGMAAGILSHLILDMFAGGVPIFFPFTLKRLTLAHIKTGGVAEWLLRAAAIGFLVKNVGAEIAYWF